jgi:hypothetical protein
MVIISGNFQQKKELTQYERGKIVGAAKFGHSPAEIAKELKGPGVMGGTDGDSGSAAVSVSGRPHAECWK